MKRQHIILSLISVFFLNIAFGQNKEIKPAGWKVSPNVIFKSNQEAIYLLNGAEVTKEIVDNLNPNTIERVDVLKGAEATALYGERGKVGLILIKTKDISKKELKKLQKLYAHEFKENKNKKAILISGKITDCEAIPMKDATISNLNTKEKTSSDVDGKYSISVHKNDVLLFSMEEYESQRVLIEKQKQIDIKLKLKQKAGPIMVKKPVIYLYPTQETAVTFTLDFKGKLATTFPKYDQQWDLIAYPDGKIFDKKTNRFYNSLFWDGEFDFPKEHYLYQDGFVVSKDHLTDFLIQKLEYLGLNTIETNDFVQYWLPILEKNELNFIHFRVNNGYDVISKNNINPKPDTSIRIFMDFYALDKPIVISEQVLPKTVRQGFTLVEWGGSDVSAAVKKLNNL